MMRLPLFLVLFLSFCDRADETVSGYGAAQTVWVLQTIDDKPFAARATLIFPEEGQLSGDAPCNGYSAAQTAPYPWFAVGQITSTKRACPALPSEALYLTTLSEMTISEVSPTTLILSNDAKRTMVFATE